MSLSHAHIPVLLSVSEIRLISSLYLQVLLRQPFPPVRSRSSASEYGSFVVAELDDNGIVCDVDDDSVEAAGGQNTITDLQSRKHCAGLLLLFLLRTIQYEVENTPKTTTYIKISGIMLPALADSDAVSKILIFYIPPGL